MKHYRKIRLLTVLILLGLLTFSCQDEINEENLNSLVEEKQAEDESNPIQLGEKLENPYSVSNMRKALDNLTGGNAKVTSVNGAKISSINNTTSEELITATHYYIKFKPKTEEELDLIKQDTLLYFFDYPLDHVAIEGDGTYRDPEVADDQPTYQYTYATIDHPLPETVKYEILEELFIPQEEEDEEETNDLLSEEEQVAYQQKLSTVKKAVTLKIENGINNDILIALEEEALRITGNLEEEQIDPNEEKTTGVQGAKRWRRPSKWTPEGYIRVYDTTLKKWIGLEGVKVRVGRWFTWRHGFVNSNGYYSTARFRRSVRYKMDWERHHFALRSGFWASAQYTGPYRRGTWDWMIGNGDRHQYYATIFRAAHHYYYKDIKGLRRPPQNTFWKSQMRIRASRSQDAGSGGSHAGVRRVWGLGDGIYIYTYGRSSSQTYATTIHELAHASHWNFQRINHNVSKLILAESWARGVQWELTRMVYTNYVPQYSTLGYTGFVQDLIDRAGITKSTNLYYDKAEGKTLRRPPGFKNYTDNVSGFTIRQLEDALKGINTFNGWRNQIKSINPNNPTKENIDETYNFWNNQ